jgi:hypothetical protein
MAEADPVRKTPSEAEDGLVAYSPPAGRICRCVNYTPLGGPVLPDVSIGAAHDALLELCEGRHNDDGSIWGCLNL